MVRTTRALVAAFVATAFLAFSSGVIVEPVSHAAEAASVAQLKAQAIYFQQDRDTERRDLAVSAMAASSTWEAELWAGFVESWSSINNAMTMNSSVPSGLPAKGHVFVVLGSGLTSSGKLSAKFERRLKLAAKAAKKYPKSKVLVTGGKPKKGHTEAEVGYKWLVANGVSKSRILVEKKASDTIDNARNSMAILAKSSTYTSYSLISDSSHLRRASILFDAAKVRVQEQSGKAWSISREANVAYMDMKNAGQVPLADWSVSYTAGNVASLFGVTTSYKKLLASPPSDAVLTGVSVTAPAKLTYAVGEKLSTKGLVVKAVYNKGVYTAIVTGAAKVSGFSSAAVGTGTATASYTDGSVTKTSSFGYTIVKASSTTKATPSTTKAKRKKTRVVMKVVVASAASGVTPTGKVRFYLDGKWLKTVTLDKDDKGRVSITYPKLGWKGKRTLTVKYAGSSTLAASSRSVAVTVS